jgi:hypothetical protein
MERIFAAVILGSFALAPLTAACAQSESFASPAPGLNSLGSVADATDLPPVPRGKSTIFGGQIGAVDPVRDELTLKVYGQHPMKILFDERTQLYLDGKRVPMHDLRAEDHASVETTLDGTNIFAVSIHVLSQAPQGDYEGRVLNYDPGTGQLTIVSSASREPFKLQVAREASFKRVGQTSFSSVRSGPQDLRTGSLISVEFESGQPGHGIANKITVLAVPGAFFAFDGAVSTLDLHSGSLVLVDPRDQRSYQISFDPARIPAGLDLHVGAHLSVRASYDGARFRATDIAAK